MIVINLSKQQTFDADSKVMEQTSFTGNLDNEDTNTTMFFVIEDAKPIILDFSQQTVRVL